MHDFLTSYQRIIKTLCMTLTLYQI